MGALIGIATVVVAAIAVAVEWPGRRGPWARIVRQQEVLGRLPPGPVHQELEQRIDQSVLDQLDLEEPPTQKQMGIRMLMTLGALLVSVLLTVAGGFLVVKNGLDEPGGVTGAGLYALGVGISVVCLWTTDRNRRWAAIFVARRIRDDQRAADLAGELPEPPAPGGHDGSPSGE